MEFTPELKCTLIARFRKLKVLLSDEYVYSSTAI